MKVVIRVNASLQISSGYVMQCLTSAEAVPVILPRFCVQDIDILGNWERTKFMFKVIQKWKQTNLKVENDESS